MFPGRKFRAKKNPDTRPDTQETSAICKSRNHRIFIAAGAAAIFAQGSASASPNRGFRRRDESSCPFPPPLMRGNLPKKHGRFHLKLVGISFRIFPCSSQKPCFSFVTPPLMRGKTEPDIRTAPNRGICLACLLF